MSVRRRAIALVVALASAVVTLTACSDDPPSEAVLLDGTRPIDERALAELAFRRARLGARWLAGVSQPDGVMWYRYFPIEDRYDRTTYNEVRHAGTTYSLLQAYGIYRDATMLAAAERAVTWIEAHAVPAPRGRAYAYRGAASLGGQALAIVALLERRRVLGGDTRHDALLRDLAAFLLWLERPERAGRHFQRYDARARTTIEGPDELFYPGEALLALTRLAHAFPGEPYLDAAVRVAHYLVRVRDGDIPATGKIPREDHWLTIALNELHRLRPDEGYRRVTYLQAESMVGSQHRAPRPYPERIGSPDVSPTISYTTAATKGEALVAAWALARAIDDEAAAAKFGSATQRAAQFAMRVQYTLENVQLFPRPERLIGGWGATRAQAHVRIDYVQHNIALLMGTWSIVVRGDVPTARRQGGGT